MQSQVLRSHLLGRKTIPRPLTSQGTIWELDFNSGGAGSYIQVPHDASLNPGSGSFTIAARGFVRSPGGTSNFGPWASKQTGDFDNGWLLDYFGTTSRFRIIVDHIGGPAFVVNSTNTFTVPNRYFVVGIIDRTTSLLSLYVNGNFEGQTSIAALLAITPPTDLWLGRYQIAPAKGIYNGTMEEVYLYNHAISAADVKNLYEKTLAADEIYGLVGWWRFQEGFGGNSTVLKDDSPKKNNGTMQSFPAGSPWLNLGVT
jgi:hypothetical protein